MKLSIKQLYELSKSTGLPVLGHDGLPFNTVTSVGIKPDTYFFRYEEGREMSDGREMLDIVEFYEKCIPFCCGDDLVAGECEIHHEGNIKWIGIDLYIDVPEEEYGVTTLRSKLVKLEPYSLNELLQMASAKAKEDPLELNPTDWANSACKMGCTPVNF